VERLIASWAQSSSVVSQGVEGDMAAGAAGVGAAGEATQGLEVLLREGEVMGGGSGERRRSRYGTGLQAWDVPIRVPAQPTAKFNPAET